MTRRGPHNRKDKTMAKTVVRFLRTHGSYVKGDVAGFAEHVARNFADAKPPIAKIIGAAEAKASKEDAGAQEQEAALAKREKALADQEAALAKREAALQEAESKAKTTAGTPPAQGAKTT
jgi:hypothetical protein